MSFRVFIRPTVEGRIAEEINLFGEPMDGGWTEIIDADQMRCLKTSGHQGCWFDGTQILKKTLVVLTADKTKIQANGTDVATVTILGVPSTVPIGVKVGGQPAQLLPGDQVQVSSTAVGVATVAVDDPQYMAQPLAILCVPVGTTV